MQRRRSFGLVATGAFVLACNGILGIEELHEEPRPSAGGATGSGGSTSSGAGGINGGTNAAGNSGRGGNAGSVNAEGGKSTTASGGTTTGEGGDGPGEAGAGGLPGGAGPGTGGEVGTGGVAGTGGAVGTGGKSSTGGSVNSGGLTGTGGVAGAGGSDTTVRGKVIDGFGHPVPDATVIIADSTANTNAKGEFSFANTATQYEVSVLVAPGVGGGKGSYAWIYQGLTRRDPTLQVYGALEDRSVDAHVTITNGVFGGPPYTHLAFGSPDGSVDFGVSSAEVTALGAISWRGPLATSGQLHALRWNTDANSIPTAYQAYYSATLAVTEPTVAQVPITFPATAVASAAVAGTVTSPTTGARRNYAFVHFTSNAAIPIVEDWSATNSFSYVAPTLANSVITVAASEGNGGPYALAHKSVAAGTSNVTLAIPTPSTLIGPGSGAAGVNGTTTFSWATSAGVSVFHAEAEDFYNGVYIVTSAKQARLSTVALGNMLAGEPYYWSIETHGTWASVDAAAGPNGFQDSFGARVDSPVGSSRAAGTYTNSEARGFTPQ